MPKSSQAITAATALGVAVLLGTIHAQVGRGGSAWLTAHGDAQRTSWIRSDALISVPTMSKPGFALQWKTALENANRGKYGLASGVSASGVTLFIPMQVVTASSNNVYAIDSDTGYVVWQRHFDAALPAPTEACPGGTLSAATRIVSVSPPPVAAEAQRGGGGRATQGYHSVLGQPGEGAPVEVRGGGAGRAGAPAAGGRGPGAAPNAPGTPVAGAPPAGAASPGQRAGAPAPGRQGGGGFGRGGGDPIPGAPADQVGGGGGLGRPSGVVYVISSDGVLHVMGLQSGKDLQKPAPFLPANSRWSDPIAVGTTLYTSTTGGCGGAPDAVWAIDLESPDKPVVSWKSDAAILGSVAFTTDGTLVVATAASIIALDPKTLQQKASVKEQGVDFITGVTILKKGDREIIAAALKEGFFLADAGTIGGGQRAVVSATRFGPEKVVAADSLSTWPDWLLASTEHSIAALMISDGPGAGTLAPRWTASNLSAPSTPIIVNGVVFVLEGGSTATLHAYDGASGKELWSSGKTMTAAPAPGSFWSAFGRVYVGTADGTLYAFGFNDDDMERRR